MTRNPLTVIRVIVRRLCDLQTRISHINRARRHNSHVVTMNFRNLRYQWSQNFNFVHSRPARWSKWFVPESRPYQPPIGVWIPNKICFATRNFALSPLHYIHRPLVLSHSFEPILPSAQKISFFHLAVLPPFPLSSFLSLSLSLSLPPSLPPFLPLSLPSSLPLSLPLFSSLCPLFLSFWTLYCRLWDVTALWTRGYCPGDRNRKGCGGFHHFVGGEALQTTYKTEMAFGSEGSEG